VRQILCSGGSVEIHQQENRRAVQGIGHLHGMPLNKLSITFPISFPARPEKAGLFL